MAAVGYPLIAYFRSREIQPNYSDYLSKQANRLGRDRNRSAGS
jgi:hypothetical protein